MSPSSPTISLELQLTDEQYDRLSEVNAAALNGVQGWSAGLIELPVVPVA